ncbi:Bug family tripartite tricarboxylate transporter substrate binding protein [Hoeflea poritis]|uniref:Tripartite tricarboxylate transporter substrate-binding protein n=1 Tax=Hoeflea poritis TaxID=2993659 RepID=A0ABT4VUV6_9HYPH|nr:tripartite tricarboxylate transporter substrate-binding protein [Hoeflea poritis]MDA4848508.1 tripartite tricarboxylate transporter substrate-binding protein [Hoeflea poritis]
MREFLRIAAATVLTVAVTVSANAADWIPPGPIKMMIAFRAGGGADTQARLIAEDLQERHGWEIIPENVTGKGGLNMANQLKGAAADGTVIGIAVTETFGYNMAAAPGAGMTPADFAGLTTTAGFQMGIVAKTDRGWASFADMVAAAEGGEQVRFGVMSPRLADLAYLLGKANNVTFNIVEVQGGRAVMDGVNAGDLDVGFMAGIQAQGVETGELVNLASALSAPLDQTPEAPTMETLGVPFNSDGQFVFVAPAGLDTTARDAIAGAIAAVVSDPETKAGGLVQRAFGGATVFSGQELDAVLQSEYEKAGELLTAASE